MQFNVIDHLDRAIAEEWGKIKKGEFYTLANVAIKKDLYISAMEQIYHYTRHNSINQATAAFTTNPDDTFLLRFVYKHALEETGHEKMVVKDLRSIGHIFDPLLSKPHPATEALIAYLYYIAIKDGAGPRLGYSYWAEDSYDHLEPILSACRRDLGLKDKDMTFFVAHSTIDSKHSEEVREVVREWCDTEEKLSKVVSVARTSLYLTGEIINSVARAYVNNELALAA